MMDGQETIHGAATGDPTPPASSTGQSTALKGAAVLALLFLVVAPATYALRASFDTTTTAEATLWIDVEEAATRQSAGAEREGDLPPAGAAWAALVRTPIVLERAELEGVDPELLRHNLSTHLDADGRFMKLRLEWTDDEAGQVLAHLVDGFIAVANDLKVARLQEGVEITEEAMQATAAELREAEESGSPERIEASRRLYEVMRERHERASLAAESWMPDVRILDPARIVER